MDQKLDCRKTSAGVWFESFLYRCTTSLKSTACWHSQHCHILDSLKTFLFSVAYRL